MRSNIQVESNIDYFGQSKAPSLNAAASSFSWAGGCQGWPTEDINSSDLETLPLSNLETPFYASQSAVANMLGIKNFDFKQDLPAFSFAQDRFLRKWGMNRIYCKVLSDPKLEKFKAFNEKFSEKIFTNVIITKIIPKENYIVLQGFNCIDMKEMEFRCLKLDLAAGTIENTRLLLNSKSELKIRKTDVLGKNLSDHLSLKFNSYSTSDLKKVMRMFSRSKTIDGLSIWPRIKLSFVDSNSKVRTFAHLDHFKFDKAHLPIIYRVLLRIGQERFYFGKSKSGRFDLNLLAEKRNDALNEITLTGQTTSGIPSIKIKFNVYEPEFQAVRQIGETYEELLKAAFPSLRGESKIIEYSQIYAGTHPSGTYRMSHSPSGGVVNNKSQLWEDFRIKVHGSGVFPRASATHPTFPSIALSIIQDFI